MPSRSARTAATTSRSGMGPRAVPARRGAVGRRRRRRAAGRVRLRGPSGFAEARAGVDGLGRAPIDGIEWLNADTRVAERVAPRGWRACCSTTRCGRDPRSPRFSIGRSTTLARWDALTARRPVVAIAGHDAHGGVGRRAEGGRGLPVPGVPSYEASFRTFSVRAVLSAPPSGDASADARALLDALRSGRVFTAIDAMAGPAVLDFHAMRGGERVADGVGAAAGSRRAERARPRSPPGARTVLFRDGRELTSADGGALELDESQARGRLPRRGPGARRARDAAGAVAGEQSDLFPSAACASWRRGPDRVAVCSPTACPGTWRRIRARPGPSPRRRPGRRARVPLARRRPREPVRRRSWPTCRGHRARSGPLTFTGQAARPARVSVQLRYPSGGGERWGAVGLPRRRSRETIVVPLDGMVPADRQTGPAPDPSSATSLLFVVDLTNALPGTANTIRIGSLGRGGTADVTPSGPARSPAARR